jgi:hypothetical protein
MVRPKSQPTQAELVQQAEWCRSVVRFVANGNGATSLVFGIENVIEMTLSRGDARGLKMVRRDLLEYVKGLPLADVAKLDASLRTQFGEGLVEVSEMLSKRVAAILRRGSILSDDEYRLLLSRVEEIYAKAEHRTEVEAINALLRARESQT